MKHLYREGTFLLAGIADFEVLMRRPGAVRHCRQSGNRRPGSGCDRLATGLKVTPSTIPVVSLFRMIKGCRLCMEHQAASRRDACNARCFPERQVSGAVSLRSVAGRIESAAFSAGSILAEIEAFFSALNESLNTLSGATASIDTAALLLRSCGFEGGRTNGHTCAP